MLGRVPTEELLPMQTKKLFVGLSLLAAIVTAVGSIACTVTTTTCGGGSFDCDGVCCPDTANCVNGACVSCLDDNAACTFDSDCCSNLCASDGLCGCIPSGSGPCSGDGDCCSLICDVSGTCG